MIFADRTDAGFRLAEKIQLPRTQQSAVLGLARGGVVVALPIAKIFHMPLGILVVKKISSPQNSELGIGAIAPDGVTFIDWKLATSVGADEVYIRGEVTRLTHEIKHADLCYRKIHPSLRVTSKTIILTDDGVATGATMFVAIKWLRLKEAKSIIVALPVAPSNFVQSVKHIVEDVVVLDTPSVLHSVGEYYKNFDQVSQENLVEMLDKDNQDGF